jgi:FtsZ-interacting cell division protein ZipA
MMQAARALAQTLDGELLDESGSTLSIQRERYLREEIIQFQHSKLVV